MNYYVIIARQGICLIKIINAFRHVNLIILITGRNVNNVTQGAYIAMDRSTPNARYAYYNYLIIILKVIIFLF